MELGDISGAQEDLATVCAIQQQLWAAILLNGGNDDLSANKGSTVTTHPDARLRGLMARSHLLRADLKLAEEVGKDATARKDAADEALEFAEEAERVLSEIAEHGALPHSPGVATMVEVEEMARKARRRSDKAW